MKRTVCLIGLVVFALMVSHSPAWAGSDDELQAKLVKMEKQLWKAWADADKVAFEKALAVDFRGVGPWGRQDKSEFLAEIGECEVESFSLDDFDLVVIDEKTALLSYKAEQDALCSGEKVPSHVVSSSLYVRRDGKWLSALYQESAVAPQP